jgi:exosome complex component RRP42
MNEKMIIELAREGKRLDGRKLDEYRQPITVESEISWTAEGSAKVQIGNTIVMAGVKIDIETPYPDNPDEGSIMVNAELLPLSSPDYESGPPTIKAVELSRVIDRGIRESGAIDLKKLCITPGKKCWFVMIDLVTINDDGNLFDAAGLAALAALKNATFPTYNPETETVDYKNRTEEKVPLVKEPIPVTVYKIGNNLFLDPTRNEEQVYEARLTVASDSNNTISALQKGGEEPLTNEEIEKMVTLALEKAKFLRGQLK